MKLVIFLSLLFVDLRVATLNASKAPPAAALPTDTRYVRVCGQYGDLTNQIIIAIKAYAIASALNRTLVLPRIKKLNFFEVFDEVTLRKGPVQLLPLAQYEANKSSEGCLFKVSTKSCPCRAMVPVTQRPNVRTLLVHARSVFGDLMDLRLFDPKAPIKAGLNFRNAACMINHLQPVATVAKDISRFRKDYLPAAYLSVHMRLAHYGATPKCLGASKRLAADLHKATGGKVTWNPVGLECVMTPEYVQQFLSKVPGRFFLGSDNVNLTRIRQLQAMGAVRYNSTVITDKTLLGVADQFLLAQGAVFIGNPFSSFSCFICDLRRAQGAECANMPPAFKPCLSYPDFLVTPRAMLHDHGAKS